LRVVKKLMCKRSKINSILAAIYFISAKPDRSIVLYPISKLWCRRDYDGIVEPLYCLHRDHPTTSTYCHHPVGVVWLTILFFSSGAAFLSLAPSSAKGYYATASNKVSTNDCDNDRQPEIAMWPPKPEILYLNSTWSKTPELPLEFRRYLSQFQR